MKTAKRILALLAAILLAGLFIATIVLALSGSAYTFDMLMVSIIACALIPTMIFVYQRLFLLMKRRRDENNPKPDPDSDK